MNKQIVLLCIAIITTIAGWSQTSYEPDFIQLQKSYIRPANALSIKEDTLMKQFKEKGLMWPAKYIYIRSFKYDSYLEVWVKQQRNDAYKLFKSYRVCALAGTLGPKRMQGDYQVPEGFYYINEFNPKSAYHLSLGLNYPNTADKLLADSLQPGGDIYIHGSCVTTGCIPITDTQIEELYIIASHAKNNGQDFIPVHIFPVYFKNKRSNEYLDKYLKDYPEYKDLSNNLRSMYYYFEKNRTLPVIMVNNRGDYVLDEEVLKAGAMADAKPFKKAVVKKERKIEFNEKEIPTAVNKLPVYPGGTDAFQKFLQTLGKDLAVYLEEGQRTTYLQMEFIVSKEGKIINPKVLKGGNDEMNEKAMDAFEAMPAWTPAIRYNHFDAVNVPVKLKQTIVVEK
jgi:murein L,D-transpeptidase YafK